MAFQHFLAAMVAVSGVASASAAAACRRAPFFGYAAIFRLFTLARRHRQKEIAYVKSQGVGGALNRARGTAKDAEPKNMT